MATFVKEYDWMWLPSGLNLSPAECRVYAYIYGLTESKQSRASTRTQPFGRKGYNGSVRQLATDLGLNAGHVSRILRKLQNDNRITLTGEVWASVALNNSSVALCNESVASCNSPLTTPLYKEYKERENREEITREENFDASLSPLEDFFLVTLAAFGLQAGARNVTHKQEQNARIAWERYTPEQQQALLDAIRKGYNVKGNFQFTVEDWLREQSQTAPDTQGEPINYNFRDPPNEPTYIACYKGEWGLYTRADIEKFNLKTKTKQ